MKRALLSFLIMASLSACGGLEIKAVHLSIGDSKEKVLSVMGLPDDRQTRGNTEILQYCQTGAGYGYHDHRIFTLRNGAIASIDSYKSNRPGSCMLSIKSIDWNRPDATIEYRNR